MAYEWIGTTALGIAGIWGTVWNGSRQRKVQREVAWDQDWRKSDLELEKEKRQAYSRLLGKFDRAISFATADKIIRRTLAATIADKKVEMDQDFDNLIAMQVPEGTPLHLVDEEISRLREQLNWMLLKSKETVSESRRIEYLKNMGYGSVELSAHVAAEELFSSAAEVSFLSEGALQAQTTKVNLALLAYLVAELDDVADQNLRIHELRKAVDTLREMMQVDLNSANQRSFRKLD